MCIAWFKLRTKLMDTYNVTPRKHKRCLQRLEQFGYFTWEISCFLCALLTGLMWARLSSKKVISCTSMHKLELIKIWLQNLLCFCVKLTKRIFSVAYLALHTVSEKGSLWGFQRLLVWSYIFNEWVPVWLAMCMHTRTHMHTCEHADDVIHVPAAVLMLFH